MKLASLILLIGTAASVVDYLRIVTIFAPPENAPPLEERIATGQRSWFFSHHADYAAATTQEPSAQTLAAANRAAHYLLDTRLMIAWARSFNETGDIERARHLAMRLREFRNPQSDDFFAPCSGPPGPGETLPFQCTAPTRAMDYRDFR